MGGDEILATLLSRKLPYPVDEAPCLGACGGGGGGRVVIDFENGSSALVSGIDETLMELGLLKDSSNDATVASSPASIPLNPSSTDDDSAQEGLVADSDSFKASLEGTLSFVEETLPEPATQEVVKVTTRRVKPSVKLVDVRERMRAEAAVKAKEEESVNPWLNAASYLAGKAAEKLFGNK
jgi:hypothetical protein